MTKQELYKIFRYYKGEKECPKNYIGTPKENFWYGEKTFSETANVEHWVEAGKQIKSNLAGMKRYFANKYTPIEFGIIVFIETQYSSHDPYDNMRWIYDY